MNRTIALATQRPQWRTGTALISSGRMLWSAMSAALADGAVDHRVGDRAIRDAPLGEDRLVLAIGHERLHRVEDRLGHAVALRDRDPVGRGPVGRAHGLELAARLLHLVVGNRRV